MMSSVRGYIIKAKRMKKRYYAITMIMFVLLFCSKNVYAEDTTWQNDYQYTKDDTNHEIVLGKYIGS